MRRREACEALVWAAVVVALHAAVALVLWTQAPPPFVSAFGAADRGEAGHYYRRLAQGPTPPCSTALDGGAVQVVAWEPRVLLYRQFLAPWEASYLMRLGEDRLAPSTVRTKEGADVADPDRTSDGAFLLESHDFVLRSIEERIALWTQLPSSHGEHMYLLRYRKGQQYKQHHDSFDPRLADSLGLNITQTMGRAGARVATVIMWLQAPEEGGATRFPLLGIDISPQAGDALLFWTFGPDNEFVAESLHSGQPVVRGEKFIATKWLRENPFMQRPPLRYTAATLPY